ncbi:MAG: hypothetical protein AB8B88_05150 [Devosiaceae bacterium]
MHQSPHLPEGVVFAKTDFCEVGIDPSVGNLPKLAFQWNDGWHEPLHRAPWVQDTTFLATMPPVDRTLSGDFVCVPFGKNDVEPGPPHGWSANSAWSFKSKAPGELALVLDQQIMGARLEKVLRPSPNAPLLYQEHRLIGGQGAVTFAHHPMIRVSGGAMLFTSPKRLAMTISTPIVEGHHALQCNVSVDDWHAVPAVKGGTIDVANLPISEGDEDFVALVEAEGSQLGWTAIIRAAFNDIIFLLKDPSVLPLTMLWHSNGGRQDSPWDGRHRHVLGIEDGIAAGGEGHKAALGENAFTPQGIASALPLAPNRTHRIGHVLGCVPRPSGWHRISNICIKSDELVIEGAVGQSIQLPFDANFFR